MAFGKIKERADQRKKEKAEKARQEQEKKERLISEKEEISTLFGTLSEKGKKVCMVLLAETQFVLFRTTIPTDDEDTPKLRRILSIIKFWSPLTKKEMATKLSTQYGIEEVFKYMEDEADEDSRFERMLENIELGRSPHREKKK